MSKSNSFHPIDTFVIRIWREWSTDGITWRGSIEHLESKRRSGFQDFERMLAFLNSFETFDKEKPRDNNEN